VTASEIILVRDAEAVAHEPHSSHAVDNDRPLFEEGGLAADNLAATFAHRRIGAVFSSPSRRATQTVEPTAEAHGLELHIVSDLRERRVSGDDLEPAAFREALERSRTDPSFSLPGGESATDVLDRALRAMTRIHSETPNGIAVAATHGGIISILRWHVGESFTVDEALNEPTPNVYDFSPKLFGLT